MLYYITFTWEWDCGWCATGSVAVWSAGGSIECFYMLRPVRPFPFFLFVPYSSVTCSQFVGLEDEGVAPLCAVRSGMWTYAAGCCCMEHLYGDTSKYFALDVSRF